ncbi:unnamed protein product [Knipowitschia caucasica]|uniref:THAP-type domain-containing protein n=1 Tax=Knipowitschia caucasica TaxID=637954 RepID=A0AAV2KGF3_KNICA
MPPQCGAIGCSNKVDAESKRLGISFHRVPTRPELRALWKKALRRDFEITKYTLICSAHFEEKDMDRTGQTTRLREGVVPSVFNFPLEDAEEQPRRSKRKRIKTKKAGKKLAGSPTKRSGKVYLPEASAPTREPTARKSIRSSARRVMKVEAMEAGLTAAAGPSVAGAAATAGSDAAAGPAFPAEDHHYAIDPDNVKQKLDEAYARIDDLHKQLRNCRDQMRRRDAEFALLLNETEKQNALMHELMEGSELWIFCDKCGAKK